MSEKFRLFFSPLLLAFSVSLLSYMFSGPLVSYSAIYLILHCVEETSTLSKVKSRFLVKLNCSLFLHKDYFNYKLHRGAQEAHLNYRQQAGTGGEKVAWNSERCCNWQNN